MKEREQLNIWISNHPVLSKIFISMLAISAIYHFGYYIGKVIYYIIALI